METKLKCSSCGVTGGVLIGLAKFTEDGNHDPLEILKDQSCLHRLCDDCLIYAMNQWNAGDLLVKVDP